MAYLKPQKLTCAKCDFRSEIMWVIGVGPNSKPGVKPSRKLHKTGAFLRDRENSNMLRCPECGEAVL